MIKVLALIGWMVIIFGAIGMIWPQAVTPSPAQTINGNPLIPAYLPFVIHDPSGATLTCVSTQAGTAYLPWLGAPLDVATPGSGFSWTQHSIGGVPSPTPWSP